MSSFLDRIQEFGTDFEQKRAIMLNGASGVGKTYQLRTCIEGGMKCLYVTTENKQATLEGLKFDTFHVKSYDFPLSATEKKQLLISKMGDMIELFDFLRQSEHGYDLVYKDSAMRYAWKMFEYLKNSVKAKSGDSDTRRAYQVFGEKMKTLLDTMAQCTNGGTAVQPVHFVCTWGVEIGSDWQGKRRVQPVVDGNMVGPVLDYHFDEVFMMGCDEDITTGDQTYTLSTMGTREYTAKKSSPIKIPPRITDPNLFDIIQVLSGKADAKILSEPKVKDKRK